MIRSATTAGYSWDYTYDSGTGDIDPLRNLDDYVLLYSYQELKQPSGLPVSKRKKKPEVAEDPVNRFIVLRYLGPALRPRTILRLMFDRSGYLPKRIRRTRKND